MDAVKIVIGASLFALGVAFLYNPALVLSMNALMREFLANDKRVVLYHKKIAILLVSLSFIALYMGMPPQQKRQAGGGKSAGAQRDSFNEAGFGAVRDYYSGDYRESLRKTLRVLAVKPYEEWAMVHLGCVYEMLGEKERASHAFARAAARYPDNKTARRKIEILGDKNKR